ncbi:acetolactate synthase catalytic subunit [Pseudoprimorskyibacter insulae]|uniref:Acetolactate synthase large subunit n=1 Tax=Pseudoprimorskyibacter insulae TaxID=1695997 RepID=A0A2R8AQP9_9RHOB|nr:acetolactate synthase catalytic subunit [Pseudoprimorskyibacter insulae]SPF78154.1 Acetolactate synthase large subunit [Pseudoprimorskyibacter insulae]
MTDSTAPETVADRIVAALKRHGVECFFGQSLPSKLVLACEAAGIRQISYRQENMGGAMADAYARVSGKIGMVVGQNGPAATLLVPPMAEAKQAGIPMIAFVQEVETPTIDRNAFQELDHMALFHGVCKFVRKIDDPTRVDDYIDMALTAANTGKPGPVALLLPADVLRGPAGEPPFPRAASLGHFPLDRPCASQAAVAEAARLIAEAKAPIVIAGGGVHVSGATQALAGFMDTAHIPVFTTNMGKGAVDETNALAGGVQGALNGPNSLARHTQPLLDEADVVLLIGTRTNQNGTDNWKIYPKGARFIHLDIDPMEIGRTYEALRLQGDARETLAALTRALADLDLSARKAARPAVEQRLTEAWAAFEVDRAPLTGSNESPIRPERVMAELQPLLTPDTIVVADASYSSMWIVGQLKAQQAGQRIIAPRGLAGLGWGMPMGLGAAVARPGAPVIALVGDGGFAHSWAELETAVRMNIPLITIVLNNGILGFQKHAETVKFGEWTSAVHFDSVDHAAVARACGVQATRVDAVGDIGPALQEALASGQPRLIEVITTPEAYPALSLFANGV